MRYLSCIAVEDHQSLGSKCVEDSVDIGSGRPWQPGVEVVPGYRAAGKPAIVAGYGHAAEHVPGQRLLPGREDVVYLVSPGLHGVADPAGLGVAMAGQPVAVALFPGERHCLREQRQHSCRVVAPRGVQIIQDRVRQSRIDVKPSRIRRASDRDPKLGFGHRPDDELARLAAPP